MNNKNNKITDVFTKLTPAEFVEKYNSQQLQVKGGALCFWGHWFGRPYDNFHRITSVGFDITTSILTIRFSEQEILTVSNPVDIKEYKHSLEIRMADKVHWQWFYYGKAHESQNLFYYNIERSDNAIKGFTNADWYKADWSDLAVTKPAVLLT